MPKVIMTDTKGLFQESGSTGIHLRTTAGIKQLQVAETTLADDNAVITAAEILTGILKCTPGGTRAKPTAAATALISGLNLSADGDSVEVSLINLAGGNTVAITDGGTDVSLVGNGVVAASSSGLFRIRRATSTTCVVLRIG